MVCLWALPSFAESKFSRVTDASKVALVHLAARLKAGGFTLLDAQFPNPHLDQFGAVNDDRGALPIHCVRGAHPRGDFYAFGKQEPQWQSGKRQERTSSAQKWMTQPARPCCTSSARRSLRVLGRWRAGRHPERLAVA
jgi:hypothetical protein